ncbi:hypothetical protein [Streptantibioticus ferralitis]|uniref:Uncharacterized protein n=1 Tax=Streptantibioticus ferralitis TaxID=236510 RepID=A0ABT5Z8Q7_9ACTN|nr:hypothetical protein [Streptantibioticus ferralitis]MDF2260215.1 hypothetical protein [Streptantibioticus ferralitis]
MRATSAVKVRADRAMGNARESVARAAAVGSTEMTTEARVEQACADARAAVEEFRKCLDEFEFALKR